MCHLKAFNIGIEHYLLGKAYALLKSAHFTSYGGAQTRSDIVQVDTFYKNTYLLKNRFF